MVIRIAVLLTLAGLAACQTSPQTQELQNRNRQLQQQLEQARSQIDTLTVDKHKLQTELNEVNRVASVLDTEKTTRARESTQLRSQVRGFVQNQIDAFKQFLVLGELLDYIGSELIERSWVDNEPLLLVDLDNRVPRNGTLTGVGAHFSEATPFTVKIMRAIGDDLVVIWESGLITPEKAGPMRQQFRVSVGVEKGDYLAYWFPQKTGVVFDQGTGNTRFYSRDVKLGESVSRAALKGVDNKRAYSIGVYGLLNLQ